MKKLFSPILLLLLLLSACQKEPVGQQEPQKLPCETENFGTLKIKNSKPYTIKVWFNGSYYGQVAPAVLTEAFNKDAGGIRVQAEQVDGFILYPDTYDFSVELTSCKLRVIEFN